MSKDFRMEVLDEILSDLYENDYVMLKLPLGILAYDDILGHPILAISFAIYNAVKEKANYLEPSEIPEPISRDKNFIPMPSFYLVNEDHLHTQAYMLSNNKWYKVLIDGEYSVRKPESSATDK